LRIEKKEECGGGRHTMTKEREREEIEKTQLCLTTILFYKQKEEKEE